MNLHALQTEMQRQAIFELGILLIVFAITCWITYAVLKAAIRDGIKESGLIETWAATVRRTQVEETKHLPEMRAER